MGLHRSDPARAVDDFGRRVAELRKLRRWTQAALAERWGVSTQYVQLVEGGHENFTVESLALLAGVLKVKPLELLRAPKSRAKRKPGRPKKGV
jgi:transcriptional regulator with XRE-family HTH domain